MIVTKVAAVAGYVGTAQCVLAITRVGAELYDPEINIDLDNNEVYQALSMGMDAIGLAGAAIAGAGTIKAVLILKGSTGKSMMNVIKGLSRQERKRLTQEILKSQNPGLSTTKMKLMQLAKTAPKRFSSSTINEGIRKQLMDAVGAMGNVTGSATSGIIGQVTSGPGEDYIVGLVNAYETQ